MAKTAITRTSALVSSAVLLASLGGSLVTATPAAAIGWCNSTTTETRSFLEWAGAGKIPVYRTGSGATRNCLMGEGAYSTAVGALQLTLNKCYGENLSVDNDFGDKTRAALIRAQKRAGVARDGVYGPNTRDALLFYFRPVTPGYDQCTRL